MPASPVFETDILVNTNQVNKAAYMITGSFQLEEKIVATTESHVLISDENQLAVLKKQEMDATTTGRIDTTEMFSKLDKLLSKWQESTGGAQKTGPIEKNAIGENYRVQIMASKTLLPNIKKLLLSMGINETYNQHYDGEYYRYTTGVFKKKEECAAYLKFIKGKGFADAFIVKYIDDAPATGD
jgi:hypothetical protein